MPIEHSQVSHLWNTSNSRHKYTTGAVGLNWPFPLPTASVTYEPLSGSFSVSWIDQTEGILIEKGEIKVVFHDGGVACQRFRAGTFPPSPTGSLSFSATTVGTTGWGTISAKFDLASTGKDYAPAFAGEFFALHCFKGSETIEANHLQPLYDPESRATSASTSLASDVNSGSTKPFFAKHRRTLRICSPPLLSPIPPIRPTPPRRSRQNLLPTFLPKPSMIPTTRMIKLLQRRNRSKVLSAHPSLPSRLSRSPTPAIRPTTAFSVGSAPVTSSSLLSART